MVRCLAWFLSILLITLDARADESQARELFNAGVEALEARDWAEAVRLLEASLGRKDKPAVRFNLVVANHELKRPLEVARHAVAFLATVEGRSHSEEAAEVRAFLTRSLGELATLQLRGLPLGVQPKIDGALLRVTDGPNVYDLPGWHRLELWLEGRQLEAIELELDAGTVQPWPRVHAIREIPRSGDGAATAETGTDEQRASSRIVGGPAHARLAQASSGHSFAVRPAERKTLALALGITGAATGVTAFATYGFVVRRAHELEDWDPARRGYVEQADQYGRARATVMPLAVAGGTLMAAGTVLVAHRPRAALAVSIAALVVGLAATGFGTALMVRTPRLLIEGAEITRPSREGGSLLIALALPLLTYGSRLQWDLWRASRSN